MNLSTTRTSPTFRLTRRGLQLHFRRATLAAREWLSPTYVRVRVAGEELRGFESLGSDDHLRVFFPTEGGGSIDAIRSAPNREYTPLRWGPGWLELEFALHGDEGVAAPWAASAPIGAEVGIGGPRGSMVIDGRPDAWLLAGDETAVPAIRRFAASMDKRAVGRVLIEVPDAAHPLPIEAPAGVRVEQVHRGVAPSGAALADRLGAISADERPEGDVFGFVAAEQAIVRPGRALLLERWGVPGDQVIVKGYWKRGTAEYHAPH